MGRCHQPRKVNSDFRSFMKSSESVWTMENHIILQRQTNILEPDGSTSVRLKLTRLPMGDRQAPGVAQWILDVLVAPLLKLPDGKVFTMIDNVRIATYSAQTFVAAVEMFLARVSASGAVLNDIEWPSQDGGAEFCTPVNEMTQLD